MTSPLKIDKKATKYFSNPSNEPQKLTLADVDDYLLRIGKPSPTQNDCWRFFSLQSIISPTFSATEDGKAWLLMRKFMIDPDANTFYKLTEKQLRTTRLLLEAFSEDEAKLQDFLEKGDVILSRQSSSQLPTTVMKPVSLNGKRCKLCNVKEDESVKILTCGKCRSVYYCNKDHQIEDWKAHKKDCKVLQWREPIVSASSSSLV
jgi:hypothetical protein